MKGKTSPCCATFILAILIISVDQNSAYSQEIQNIGTRTLYLIRHGDYDHQDRRDPDIGRGLVPLGIAQTRLVADRLRSLPDKITSLHSSTTGWFYSSFRFPLITYDEIPTNLKNHTILIF